jgi:hypothetical protein
MAHDTFFVTTSGGWWHNVEGRKVKILALKTDEYSLNAYFSRDTWDVREDGLLYTDDAVQTQIEDYLIAQGMDEKIVRGKNEKGQHNFSDSEQGLQGSRYINFDIREVFRDEFKRVFGTEKVLLGDTTIDMIKKREKQHA